jgi:hypothetical protein
LKNWNCFSYCSRWFLFSLFPSFNPLQQHPRRLILWILRQKLPLERLFQYALAQSLRLRKALLHGSRDLVCHREAALDLGNDAALLGEGR